MKLKFHMCITYLRQSCIESSQCVTVKRGDDNNNKRICFSFVVDGYEFYVGHHRT